MALVVKGDRVYLKLLQNVVLLSLKVFVLVFAASEFLRVLESGPVLASLGRH
jgi:hypothetical protein